MIAASRVGAAFVLALSAGGASAQQVPPDFTFRVEAVDQGYRPTESASVGQTVGIGFAFVPGALGGTAPGSYLRMSAVVGQWVFVGKSGLTAEAEKVAQPFKRSGDNDERTIEPPDTRIARLSAFPTIKDRRVFIIDPITREPLVMVYFDRPCRMEGIVRATNGTVTRYDISVTNPGLHWIAVERQSDKEFRWHNKFRWQDNVDIGLLLGIQSREKTD